MKTHEPHKSKTAAAAPEMFSQVEGTRPLFAERFATALELYQFTGATEDTLRRLAREINPATGSPWLPAPANRKFQIEATLAGIREYKDHQIAHAEKTFEALTFPSMENCASRTGISKTIQQLAKENGCDAFDAGGRVRIAKLVGWLFAQGVAGDVQDWTAHAEKFRALNEELKFREASHELVARAEVKGLMAEFASICFGAIKRLEMECPRDFEMRAREFIKKSFADKRRLVFKLATEQLKKLEDESPA